MQIVEQRYMCCQRWFAVGVLLLAYWCVVQRSESVEKTTWPEVSEPIELSGVILADLLPTSVEFQGRR